MSTGLGCFGDEAGEGSELFTASKTGRVAHRGNEGGAADGGDTGQTARQTGGVDALVGVFTFGGVGDEFALHGA